LRTKKLNGVKFRRQEPIGPYVVDFVSYEKKLIIEIDGGQHSFEGNKENDEARTKWGFRVIRCWNNDVSLNLEGVMAQISEALEVHPLPFPLPLKGEGTNHIG
jgi:very-short-patch-repair endonuclease